MESSQETNQKDFNDCAKLSALLLLAGAKPISVGSNSIMFALETEDKPECFEVSETSTKNPKLLSEMLGRLTGLANLNQSGNNLDDYLEAVSQKIIQEHPFDEAETYPQDDNGEPNFLAKFDIDKSGSLDGVYAHTTSATVNFDAPISAIDAFLGSKPDALDNTNLAEFMKAEFVGACLTATQIKDKPNIKFINPDEIIKTVAQTASKVIISAKTKTDDRTNER